MVSNDSEALLEPSYGTNQMNFLTDTIELGLVDVKKKDEAEIRDV